MVAASAFQPRTATCLPAILRVAEPGALLAVPVDPLLHRVDVHECEPPRPGGSGASAPASRGTPGPPSPAGTRCARPIDRRCNKSAGMGPGLSRTGRTSGAWRSTPISSMLSRRPCPRPGTRPSGARSPWRRVDAGGRTRSPTRAGEPARSARPSRGPARGVPHEKQVIERRAGPRQAMQQLHLQGVLSNRVMEASDTPILPAQRAPFTLTRPKAPLFDRCKHRGIRGRRGEPGAKRIRGRLDGKNWPLCCVGTGPLKCPRHRTLRVPGLEP